jgi:Methyltransferase domain
MAVDALDAAMASPYLRLIHRIHRHVRPRTYVEIGVSTGRSLALAMPETIAVGVDPEPRVQVPLGANARVMAMTSDDFFARHSASELFGDLPLDLAFIDGMHRFEFALRDFVNLEQWATERSVILVHDCYPIDEVSAARERTTKYWSGDIWRLIVCLKARRPDLQVAVVDAAPTGLGVIRGLDPRSEILRDQYDDIVDEYLALPYRHVDAGGKARVLNRVPNDWPAVRAVLDGASPTGRTGRASLIRRLGGRLRPASW